MAPFCISKMPLKIDSPRKNRPHPEGKRAAKEEGNGLLQAIDQLHHGGMDFLGAVHADVGAGFGQVGAGGGVGGGGLQGGVGVISLLLQGGKFSVDGGELIFRQAGEISQIAQGVKGPVVGVGPVGGQYLEAFHGHPFHVFVGLVGGGGVAQAFSRLFLNECGFRRAQLISSVGVGGQHGIIRHEHVVAAVVHGDPFHRVGDAVLGEGLEDVDFQVIGAADAGDVIISDHVLDREGVIGGDIGIQGHDVALGVHVGDGIISGDDFFLGLGEGGVKELQRRGITAIGGLIGQIRGDIIDGVGGFVAHEGAGFLGGGDQLVGGDDVLVVQVDQADGALIRHGEGHGFRQFQGDILGAGGVFDVPGLGVVGDKDARAALAAHGVIDVQQKIDGFLGGGAFAQKHGGDFGFLDAGLLAERIHGLDGLAGAAEGLGGGDGQAHFVGAAGLIGRVGMLAAAVGAEAGEVIIAESGVGVAVLGEGVGEAVAALIHFACLVLAGGRHIEHLVVAVGDVLRAGEHGGAVFGQVSTDVNRRAGKGRNGGQAQHCGQGQGENNLEILHGGNRPFGSDE